MSMLAGPRRKQKFTLNPRGKHWSEDPNKFGQKMLEKMGWSAGKGLGAKEQGMTEHVRVRVKNDQVGIGYEKDKDDHWTEHQDDFNSFLQNLQKEQAGNIEDTKNNDKILSGKSLEEKSKQSQKRVHYKKFTRGKDVNKYSTKDLANIFGKRDLNESTVKEEKIEEEEEVVYDPIGSKDMTAGVLTVKGGNMDDYFKKKSSTFQQNGTNQIKEEHDDECETRVGFGYSTKTTSKFYVNDNGDHEQCESENESQRYVGFGFTKSSEAKPKTKKRMDLNYVYDNPCLDLNILDASPKPKTIASKVIDSESSENITPKKRKSEFSYNNEGLDLNCPDRPTPKKRRSEFSYENKGIDLGFSENQGNVKSECNDEVYKITEESCEFTEKRKSKKSKKIKNESLPNGIDNLALNLNTPDRCTAQISNVTSESVSPDSNSSMTTEGSVCSKNKLRIIKDEIISNGFSNLGLDLNYTNKLTPNKRMEVEAYENPALDVSLGSTPKNKKKIKSPNSLNAFDNPGLDENFPSHKIIETESSYNSIGFCNPGLDLDFPDKPTPKKCKKAKEEQIAFNGIENPGLDLEDKPTPKKCKKAKEEQIAFNGIENPGLDLEDKPTPKKPKRSKSSQVSSNGLEDPGMDLDYVDTPTPKKSKKSKKSSMISNEFENPSLEVSSFTNEVCSGMDYEVSRISTGVENNALNLSDEDSCKKRVTFNDQLEYNTDVAKKKKKKKKNALDKYEVVTDKLKKKHKRAEQESVTSFVNEGLDLHMKNEEEIENEINERKSRKSKRRKERRMSSLETIEEAPEEENSNEATNMEIEGADEKEDLVMSIPSENMDVDAVDNGSENVPVKKNKKKKAKKNVTENIEEIEVHIEPIDKKKKKKSVKEEAMEIFEVNSPEKENKCTTKDKVKKTDDKKSKDKSLSDDVISLEEFLNEEDVPKTKKKSKNQSADSEKCTESEKTEVTVAKENNKNSHQRFRKTKEVMKSLFIKNPTLLFNGSNINEIKGYGSQFYDNY